MSVKRKYRVAAAAYPLDQLDDWSRYAAKIRDWVGNAAAEGAELLVFPEYGGQELAALFGPEILKDADAQIDPLTELLPQVDALHAELAAEHGVHILAGSLSIRRDDGAAVNRARLFAPSGESGVQDKLIMTPWERDPWRIEPGASLRLFDTALGRLGVAICYDVEFPLIARALVEAGAELILAPSCTETLAGYWRVRIGAQARALENQCYVVQAPTVGDSPGHAVCDVNRGAAGIYCPPDKGFPPDGVVARGVLDAPGWTYAPVDLDRTGEARLGGGGVNGWRHWPEQAARLEGGIEVVAL